MPLVLFALVGIAGFVYAAEAIQIWGYSTFEMEGEFAAPFYEGWNLILGFGDPAQLSGHLEESNIKAIYAFDYTKQEYIRTYPNPEKDKLRKLREDYLLSVTAFFVYSDKTVEGSLNGMNHASEYWVTELAPLNEKRLVKGWNLVGITPDMYHGTLDGAGYEGEYFSWDSIKGDCVYEKIFAWNPEAQEWIPMNSDLILKEYDFDDFLGSGMVVKVIKDCKLRDSGGELPSVPPIPN